MVYNRPGDLGRSAARAYCSLADAATIGGRDLTDPGGTERTAAREAERIQRYWAKQGHPEVKAWPVHRRLFGFTAWGVDSNLVRGLPPKLVPVLEARRHA